MSRFYNTIEAKLDAWIDRGRNVLFKGKHGVGKTALIVQAFERAGVKYRYFSAATMDPWVDFVGVPKSVRDPKTGKSVLTLIRPREFEADEVEAIFLDEFSRAHKKVRNAAMELIQFKSINGRPFKNLKIVWAAINPDDDAQTYDVERLDPAQMDRFHVQVDVPYEPYVDYFVGKYGKRIAFPAIEWWRELPEPVKDIVSPRRLDYALQEYQDGGNLRDVLHTAVNVPKLQEALRYGSIILRIYKAIETLPNQDLAKELLESEATFERASRHILRKKIWIEKLLRFFPQEKLAATMQNHGTAFDYVMENIPVFDTLCKEMVLSGSKLGSRIKKTDQWKSAHPEQPQLDESARLKQKLEAYDPYNVSRLSVRVSPQLCRKFVRRASKLFGNDGQAFSIDAGEMFIVKVARCLKKVRSPSLSKIATFETAVDNCVRAYAEVNNSNLLIAKNTLLGMAHWKFVFRKIEKMKSWIISNNRSVVSHGIFGQPGETP